MRYIGRFAPSPTGALHAGSLVAALASWLDAKAHGGTWLVRIEDVDTPRCIPGAAKEILRQLAACGLNADQPPVYQSQRSALYQAALDQLIARQAAYALKRRWQHRRLSSPGMASWSIPALAAMAPQAPLSTPTARRAQRTRGASTLSFTSKIDI
jgi:tRNA synthetases class I (E and Q), catalytic domain